MAYTPDLSALTTSFVELGAQIFLDRVNNFDMSGDGILVYKNVKTPQALPKLTVTGEPRPYRPDDDLTTPAAVADRILTAYQSKWDYNIDPEVWRNTYLAKYKAGDAGFADFIMNAVAIKYLSLINDSTAYLGVHDANGTGAVDLATGWGTIIANEITATTLTPVTTGAYDGTNAVAKVKTLVAAVPVWMRKAGFRVLCSYGAFDDYATNYASTFTYQFQPDALGKYRINNTNGYLWPVSWMGTSRRLIATVDNNLVMGTDGDSIAVAPSIRRNIIEIRQMMPIGFQIADLKALVVNDQA